MDTSDIISLIALVISLLSSAFSVYTFYSSKKQQRKCDTIEAFNRMQEQVLDKLVSYPKKDVNTLIECIDEAHAKECYDDFRAMISKIEHFAVGVNTGVYDFNTADQLGGVHLYFLYKKVQPIILKAREGQQNDEKPYYCEFEKMIKKFRENHSECQN